MSVQINLEIGHEAAIRSKRTISGFTHDWHVFVNGIDNAPIHHYIEKVVFHLHETFPNPKRVIKEPPYSVRESGYAGFNLPIDIYIRSNEEPKKIRFNYDIDLQPSGPAILRKQKEKYVFNNPSNELRDKLLKGGGTLVNSNDSRDEKLILTKPKLSGSSDLIKKHKIKEHKAEDSFTDLFGTPITKTSKILVDDRVKNSPVDVKLVDKDKKKSKSKHSPKDKERDKEKKDKSGEKKHKEEKKSKERSKDKERKDKNGKREKSPKQRSPSPQRRISPKRVASPLPVMKRPPSPITKRPASPLVVKKEEKKVDEVVKEKLKSEEKSKKKEQKDKEKKEHKSHKDKDKEKNREKEHKNKEVKVIKEPVVEMRVKEKPSRSDSPVIKEPEKVERPKEKFEIVEKVEKAEKTKHKHKKKDNKEKKERKEEKNKEKKSEKKSEKNASLFEKPYKDETKDEIKNTIVNKSNEIASENNSRDKPSTKTLTLQSQLVIDSSNSSLSVDESSVEAPVKPEKKTKEKKDPAGEKRRKRKHDTTPEEPPTKIETKSPPKPPPEENDYVSSSDDKKENVADDIPQDYMSILKDLQHRIMTLQDNRELQKVVQLIAETGHYELTSKTFDFDLCALDRDTVRRLQEFFALT